MTFSLSRCLFPALTATDAALLRDLTRVAWSAVDARKSGFTTDVIEGAMRAIGLNGLLAAAWKQMTDAGVKRIQSADVQTA